MMLFLIILGGLVCAYFFMPKLMASMKGSTLTVVGWCLGSAVALWAIGALLQILKWGAVTTPYGP